MFPHAPKPVRRGVAGPLAPAFLTPALLAMIGAGCRPSGAESDAPAVEAEATAAPASGAAADAEAVRQRALEWAAAEASNDVEAAVSFMWVDAVMQPPNAPQIQGHEAIRQLYGAVTFLDFDPGPLTVKVSGDLAVVWSPRMTYTLTMGGDTITDDAKFVAVWERREGVWKVLENSWNSNLAPARG